MAASARPNGKPLEKQDAPDAVWNVARCNRLLRPISSKIKALRREASSAQTIENQDRRNNPCHKGASGSEPSRSTKSAQHLIEDQDWAFYKPKQGVKRKYGNRSTSVTSVQKKEHVEKRIESTPNRSGPINVPTPYIRKLFLGQQHSPLSSIQPNNQTRESQENKSSRVVRLAKSKHLCSSTEGLGQAFEQVLIATKGTTPPKMYSPAESEGAPSLFSMCLRSLPKAISEEQNERAASDPDDKSDVSAEVYASLEETFEITPGRGWLPFRDLVLAHVVEIFKEGFEEHLFEPAFIRALLDYCKLYGAFTEAQSLLAFFAAREETAKPPRTSQDCISKTANLYSLNFLNDYVMKLFSLEFKIRMVSNLVETGKIHIAWITGRGPDSVRELASTLTGPDASVAVAGEHMTANALLASCGLLPIVVETKQIRKGRPRKGRYLRELSSLPSDCQNGIGIRMCTTVGHLCSLFCALALAPFFENRHSEICDRVARIFNNVSISIRQNLAAISQNPLVCRIAMVILLADYIMSITVSKSQDEQGNVVNRSKAVALAHLYTPTDLTADELKPDMGLIVVSVECLNIAKKDYGTTLILKIIESLRSSVDWHNPTVDSPWSPWKLALDIALHYSQKSHPKARAKYAAIAVEIEEQIQNSRRRVEDRQAARGLRWEEGICEWVTADTPAGIKRVQRTQPSQRSSSQPLAPKAISSTKASPPVNALVKGSRDPSSRPGPSSDIGFAKYAKSNSHTSNAPGHHPHLFDFNNIFIRNFSGQQPQPPQEEKTTAKSHTLKRKPSEPLLPIINNAIAKPNTNTSKSARASLASSKAEETDPDESSLFSTASVASSMSSCTSLMLSQGAESSPPKITRTRAPKPKPSRLPGLLNSKPDYHGQTKPGDNGEEDSDRDELSITPLHVRYYSKTKRVKLR